MAACLALSLPALAQTASPSQYTVDFSKSDNLKAVFDAGLRPWRYPGELGRCELGKENITVILSGNVNFPISIDFAQIHVLDQNQISEIDLTTDFIEFPQAARQIHNLCQAVGIPTKEFDAYVDSVNHGGPVRQTLSQLNTKVGKVDINVGYDSPLGPEPRIRMWVNLNWPRPD